MRVVGFLLCWFWAAAVLAQTMYKCVDGKRRVTYSNISCEKQGLQDAGSIADRTTSMLFTDPPKPAASTERPDAAKTAVKPPASGAADEAETGRGAAQVKPVSPLIEKLTK